MFLEHISASRGKEKTTTNSKTQEQWLVATCQLFFHSIVLMETADHKVKEERRGSKEEMLPRWNFNGRTHSTNSWSFKAAQHVRQKSSHVGTAHLEDFCCQTRDTCLSAQYRSVTYHTTVHHTWPHLEWEIRSQPVPRVWAYLKPPSWSTQKLCPVPTGFLSKIYSIADYWDTLHQLLERRRSFKTIKAQIAAHRL